LNLSLGAELRDGSAGLTAWNIVCHEENATPLVSKKELAKNNFKSLSSMPAGDGEIFYKSIQNDQDELTRRHALLISTYNIDHSITDSLDPGSSIPGPPNYRTLIHDIVVKCDENKWAINKVEWWNTSNELVRVGIADRKFADFYNPSPVSILQAILCEQK
jgi:hypothetical protein